MCKKCPTYTVIDKNNDRNLNLEAFTIYIKKKLRYVQVILHSQHSRYKIEKNTNFQRYVFSMLYLGATPAQINFSKGAIEVQKVSTYKSMCAYHRDRLHN